MQGSRKWFYPQALMKMTLGVAVVAAMSFSTGQHASATHSTTGESPIAIANGYAHTLALRADKTVWAWGSDYYGQLGDGGGNSSPLRQQVRDPQDPTTYLTQVKAVAAKENHSLALKEDGTVYEWGAIIKDPYTWEQSVTIWPTQVGNLSNVTSIVAGKNHSLALKADGTVWAWGANGSGQLGDGTTSYSASAVQVTDPTSPTGKLTGVVALAAGGTHSLALKSDGTLWAWGSNEQGQLGNGTTVPTDQYQTEPQAVVDPSDTTGKLTGIVGIAANGNHSLALKSDGTVRAWGANMYQQIGLQGMSQSTPNKITDPNDPTGYLTGVTALSASAYSSIALKSDGTVWGWGMNVYGAFSNPDAPSMSYTPVPFKNPADTSQLFTGAVAISGGGTYHSILKSDATIWSAGKNSEGQIGDGSLVYNRNLLTQAALYNDHTAPAFVNAYTDETGTVLYLQFNENISVYGYSSTAFTLRGTSATMSSFNPQGNTLVIFMNGTITAGQQVTLDWYSGAVKDVFGNSGPRTVGVAVENRVQ